MGRADDEIIEMAINHGKATSSYGAVALVCINACEISYYTTSIFLSES